MAIRTATAEWKGTLKEGSGQMKGGSGAFNVPFSFKTRFEEEPGTNPEELIGAAQAGCFSMFLAAVLTEAGFPPKSIHSEAKVHLGEGPTVTLIELTTEAHVAGVDKALFDEKVAFSKTNCPISKALNGPDLKVSAKLVP